MSAVSDYSTLVGGSANKASVTDALEIGPIYGRSVTVRWMGLGTKDQLSYLSTRKIGSYLNHAYY